MTTLELAMFGYLLEFNSPVKRCSSCPAKGGSRAPCSDLVDVGKKNVFQISQLSHWRQHIIKVAKRVPRFEIALLLHANPKLRDHRKHALSEGKSRGKDDTNDPDEPKESSEGGSKKKNPDEASPA